MKKSYSSVLYIFISILIAFTFILSGCNKADRNESGDTVKSGSSTVDSYTKEEAVTKESESEIVVIDEPEEPMRMVDFFGCTISDIIDMYGTDYTISEYLYRGGWGYFYYENIDCPYTFYFRSDVTTIGTIPSIENKLTAVGSSGDAGEVYVHDDVTTSIKGDDLADLGFGGEWYEDCDSGLPTYSYSYDELCNVTFYWKDSVGESKVDTVHVTFNY